MYRLQKREMIDVATIERRGGTGGFVAPVPLEEQFVDWKSGKERDVITFVASLAGERLFFEGDNSAGVGGDLQNATTIVAGMEAYAGMGATVGSRGYMPGAAGATGSVITGEDRNFLETELGRRVETRLQELLQRRARDARRGPSVRARHRARARDPQDDHGRRHRRDLRRGTRAPRSTAACTTPTTS